MRVYISSFSPSKSFQFVNDQLSWEEENFHHHDYHDPPHALRVGLYDDQYPPQRLAAVARSDHWKTTPAQVGFPRASNPKVKIALVWEGGLLSEQHWRGLVLSEELPSGCLQVKRGLVVQAIWYIVTADTQIRRELHSFPSKVAEIPAFVSKMLHQSLDFHKRSFSAPGVLIYESDGVSHPPTFG